VTKLSGKGRLIQPESAKQIKTAKPPASPQRKKKSDIKSEPSEIPTPAVEVAEATPSELGSKLEQLKFKIRHQPEFNSGILEAGPKGNRIVSDVPISGIAPGQFAVLYDEEEKTCLGSAVITDAPDQ